MGLKIRSGTTPRPLRSGGLFSSSDSKFGDKSHLPGSSTLILVAEPKPISKILRQLGPSQLPGRLNLELLIFQGIVIQMSLAHVIIPLPVYHMD